MKASGSLTSPPFPHKLEKALEEFKKVLDRNRNPVMASHIVNHEYQDKYILAENAVRVGAVMHLIALRALGVSDDMLRAAKASSARV